MKIKVGKKIKIFSIIAFITVLTFIGHIGISLAATASDLQKEKQSVKAEISDTEEQLDAVKEELSETMTEVQDLIEQISDYEEEIDTLDGKIDEASDSIEEAEKQIEEAEVELEEKQDLLNRKLVAFYKNGDTTFLDVLLSSDSITDFISNYYLIEELTAYDTSLIESVQETKDKIEASKQELEDDKTELEALKEKQEAKKEALAVVKKEKENKVATLSSSEKELEKEIEELKQHEKEVSSQIQKLAAAYDSSISSSGSGSSNLNSNAVSSYGFGWPVANPVISCGYGVAGRYWSSGYHTGVDFRASSGTSVYSVGEGVVVDTGYNSAYGNYVEIYHGNDIYSFYAHNTSVIVRVDQIVSRGTKIANSGATGNVTGPHVHFEIRKGGSKYENCVNPMPYLP